MSVIYKNQYEDKDIEKAFKKSCSKEKIVKEKKTIKVPLKRIVVLAVAVVTIASFASLANIIDRQIKLGKIEDSISMMSYDEYDQLPEESEDFTKNFKSILNQNTYRTYNNANYWYNAEDIASDYEKLPYYAILPAIANDYIQMFQGTKNMDQVIFHMHMHTKDHPEAAAYRYVCNCTDFESFLISNGFCYTDKDTGKLVADKDGFIKANESFCLDNMQRFIDDANAHVEELKHGR